MRLRNNITITIVILLILTLASVSIADPGRGTQRPYRSGATVYLPFPIEQLVDGAGGTRLQLLERIMDHYFGSGHDKTSISILIWDLEPNPTSQLGEVFMETSLLALGYSAANIIIESAQDITIPSGTNLVMVLNGYDDGTGTTGLTLAQRLTLRTYNLSGSDTTQDGCLYIEGTNFAEDNDGLTILTDIFEANFNDAGVQVVDGVAGNPLGLASGLSFEITNPQVTNDIDDTTPRLLLNTYSIFTEVSGWEKME